MNLFRRRPAPAPPARSIFHAQRFQTQSGSVRADDLAPDGDSIGGMEAGAWAGYGRVDFSAGPDLFLAFACAGAAGRRIEVRIDSPAGVRLAELAAAPAGGAGVFTEQSAPLEPAQGEHDVFLVFPDGPVGVDWFTLTSDPARETPAGREERMRWWRTARFGQFVHWGAYSVLGRGEWIMYRENWPRRRYEERAAARFRPAHFNAGSWVRTVADAGQRYLVVTAKHHDGFCLWDTRVRGFDAEGEPEPAGNYDLAGIARGRADPLGELARECRKRGVRFGLSYSILDWHHPSQLPASGGSGLTDMVPGRKDGYVSAMKEQLRELIEAYDPDLLWFDGDGGPPGWWWTPADGAALYRFVRALKPGLIVNDRVRRGGGLGDYLTPEQTVSAASPGGDWEICRTLNDHRGYHALDQRWKSARDLIRMLADCASRGGNLLLNVGPQPDGKIPRDGRERLEDIGGWMRSSGESIYGTSAGPFAPAPAWGCCTAAPGRLYAHVFDWPSDRILRVPALRNIVLRAYLLGKSGSALPVERTGGGIEIGLPARAPDVRDSVVVLEVEGTPDAASSGNR
jgi:alpha-L-fucosidase